MQIFSKWMLIGLCLQGPMNLANAASDPNAMKYMLALQEMRPGVQVLVDAGKGQQILRKFQDPEMMASERACLDSTNNAVALILAATEESSTQGYHQFIQHFRQALETDFYRNFESQPDKYPLVRVLQGLAMQLYTSLRMHDFLESYVNDTASKGGCPQFDVDEEHAEDSRSNRFQLMKRRLIHLLAVFRGLEAGKDKIDSMGKACNSAYGALSGGVTWAPFDPINQGNIPYVKFTMKHEEEGKEAKVLTLIRMATPTINSDKDASISPEFRAYLIALKNRGLKHVYVNYQDNIPAKIDGFLKGKGTLKAAAKLFGIADESYRTGAIENLNDNPDFQGVLSVLTLGRDSHFYNQEAARYPSQMAAKEFIDTFIRKLFADGGNGYHVPAAWRGKSSAERIEIERRIALVHKHLFAAKKYLNIEERKIFLDLCYVLIVDFATRDAYSVNQTCKSGIDRAGLSNALSFVLAFSLEADPALSDLGRFQRGVNALDAMIFGDALTAKKREAKQERVFRFLWAANYLVDTLASNPEAAQALRKELYWGHPELALPPVEIIDLKPTEEATGSAFPAAEAAL